MDSIFAISLGLGLRLLVDVVSHQNFRVGGSLVGLWEGVVLYHFLNKMPRSFDPYVGYGFRLFVDFLFTESLSRLTVVLLWTGLGMVLSDIGPVLWSSTGLKHLFRRLRRIIPYFELPAFNLFPKSPRVRFHTRTLSSRTSSVTSAQSPVPRPATIRPDRISRRPPGAFPGDWTESDTDTVMTVLPIPPPSRNPSPRDAPRAIPDHLSDVSDEADIDATPPHDLAVEQSEIPEIPTEDLHQADHAHNVDQDSTPTNHPVDPSTSTTDQPAETNDTHETQPPLIDIPEMHITELSNEEKDREVLASLNVDSSEPLPDPPPPFEEVEGGGNNPRDSLYADTEHGRPDSVLSGLSTTSLIRRAEMCRREARDVEKEKVAFESRQKEALENKKTRDAFLLKREIDEAEKRAQKLHEKAEERYFRGRNNSQETDTIDIRGLEPTEARKRVFARLHDLLANDGASLRIKVGGEKQPIDKVSIVKSTLRSALNEHHMPTEDDQYDSTTLVVSLPNW